ncbi:phosphoribosylglycinamide formyltransferase [Mycobacteroides franklinii]|uniref:Phosphoribosylglycinamide formyltransferase n=1 Tax=Mycobacteroides franklinii TaxID=948102 RepID=A0A4R8QZE8_9MYCO|nr:Phosphoribosylglycinamide formyltransferase [Mycobacteroides franklinii]TDZ47119.1 Phosphoribosylglycinamide formyltransferase [Mycobacteroides franklinii]TDZ55248.1 Phosphoribosylglycinamide formyltransferase [Mycobacteroides franklinii]TDZ62189.1 Phosphoribosylglycinamide formyltransferase [Mycobacteroides franklinii]TDZ68587.1 Phosphoribosylglycinamide formyltransferase [Mycobacteroides franklinii]
MTSPATLSGVSEPDPLRASGSSTPGQSVEIAPSAPARVVVLASGTGTLLRSLLDAAAGDFPARIVAVGTDRECAALDIAAGAELPSYTARLADYESREQWDAAITEATAVHRPDLVVSAGFMKILGPRFLSQFLGRVINTHPALLPSFPGAHAVPEALAHGVKVTGCTVHLVDAGMDTGPILAQQPVPVHEDDDEASLHERIKVVERALLVDVLAAVATRGLTWNGRRASIK